MTRYERNVLLEKKGINLGELKECIDNLCKFQPLDSPVLITTSDSSIGARAAVGVFMVCNGFDWEHGQIRIEPVEKLIKYGKDRDDIIAPHESVYEYPNGRKHTSFSCKRCGSILKKDGRYCGYCGQRYK